MILVISAHPNPASFSHTVVEKVLGAISKKGEEARHIDLYRLPPHPNDHRRPTPRNALKEQDFPLVDVDGKEADPSLPLAFPPRLDFDELQRRTSFDEIIQEQMRLLEESCHYVLVHPDWWGGPPALLKGWVDRVLRPVTAYEVSETLGDQKIQGVLTGRKALIVISGDAEGPGPLRDFWIDRVWNFCGVEAELLYMPYIRDSSLIQRRHFLEKVEKHVGGLFLAPQG